MSPAPAPAALEELVRTLGVEPPAGYAPLMAAALPDLHRLMEIVAEALAETERPS